MGLTANDGGRRMRMARGRKVTLGVGASGDGEGTIARDEP